MYSFANASTIYVSQKNGNDNQYNGFAPEFDGFVTGPFKTLGRALHAVYELRVTGIERPITILLTDDYYLDDTVIVGNMRDRHDICDCYAGDGVKIASYGKRKRIIGGIKVTGWQKDTFNGAECFSAVLPAKKDGSAQDVPDLFVNGKRYCRTRYPKEGEPLLKALDTEVNRAGIGLFDSSKWFVADKKDLENIPDVENTTVNFFHYWVDEHSPVESYDRETGKLVLKNASRFAITTQYEPEENTSALRYCLENVPCTFGSAGEWYFDRESSKIYFVPAEKEMRPEEVEAYIPTVLKMFSVLGTPGNHIKDVRFENLEFFCTSSRYVSRQIRNNDVPGCYEITGEGGYASDIQSVCWASGAVSFLYADRCLVQNCVFHGTGLHGVEITEGCHGIRIEDNEMFDLGAGGVRIFGSPDTEDETGITGGHVIRHNDISRCGRCFAAGCGILVCHSSENEISENTISYLDYTGISVGWVWGYEKSMTYGNRICRNHIHHIGMGKLSDMGGIYLLGKQHGTVVSENLIHDVNSAHYGGWGLYTDEGSSFITLEKNVVYGTKCECYHQHYGSQNVISGNIFISGKEGCVRVSRREIHAGTHFERNIFVTLGDTEVFGKDGCFTPVSSRDNLFWNADGKEPVIYKGMTLSEWQKKTGFEEGSIVCDPLIKDLAQHDFTLAEDSPAYRLGFEKLTGVPKNTK